MYSNKIVMDKNQLFVEKYLVLQFLIITSFFELKMFVEKTHQLDFLKFHLYPLNIIGIF